MPLVDSISFHDAVLFQLQAAAVMGVAWAAARLLGQRSAVVRHRVWSWAMLGVVLVPVASWAAGLVQATEAAAWVPTVSLAVPVTEIPQPAAAAALDGSAAGLGSTIHWTTVITVLWAVGVGVLLAHLAAAWVGSVLLRAGSTEAPADVVASLRTAARRTDARVPALRVSDALRTPIVIGAWRPMIVVPTSALQWSARRLEASLVHELAHVAQGDHRWFVLARIVRAVCWVNPLAWYAHARLRADAEFAADDAVVGAGIEASSYAEALLGVACDLAGRRPAMLGAAMVTRSEVGRRIERVLAQARIRRALTLRTIVPLALGGLGAVAAVAWVQLPPRVAAAPVTVAFDARTDAAAPSAQREYALPTMDAPGLPVDDARWRADIGADRLLVRSNAFGRAARASIELDDGRLPAHAVKNHLIGDAFAVLEAPDAEASERRPLWVFADRSTPWATLLDVVYTGGRAGLRSYRLAFQAPEGIRALEVAPPMFRVSGEVPAVATRFDARLAMTSTGVRARVVTSNQPVNYGTEPSQVAPTTTEVVSAGRCELVTGRVQTSAQTDLRKLGEQLCETNDGRPFGVTLIPAAATTYEEIVFAMASVQRNGCGVSIVLEAGPDDVSASEPGTCPDAVTLSEGF